MVRYYHLYNRGVDKRAIFLDKADRRRFIGALRVSRLSNAPRISWIKRQIKSGALAPKKLKKLEETHGPPLVDIIAYCLMPNHFHFQVKELVEEGVSKFFRRLGTSYAMYFNIRHERTGRLFESQYKSVLIETDEQLIHLSRYIHSNPSIFSKINLSLGQLKRFPWSSLPDYLETRKQPFCDSSEVMSFFASPNDYWQFLKGNINKKEVLLSELLIDSG